MYYSSKQVIDLEPPVTTHEFQPVVKIETLDPLSEETKVSTEHSDRIVYLGKIDDTFYHFVPDDQVLADQPEKAEVTKLESLPEEAKNTLTLSGDYVAGLRYSEAAKNVPYPIDAYQERNQVALWQAISDISTVLAQLLEQTPLTIDTGPVNIALETIKKFKAQTGSINTKLEEVGL